MTQEAIMKGRVGKYEYWLAGKMRWEVRKEGKVLAVKTNLSEASSTAQRFYELEKAGA